MFKSVPGECGVCCGVCLTSSNLSTMAGGRYWWNRSVSAHMAPRISAHSRRIEELTVAAVGSEACVLATALW